MTSSPHACVSRRGAVSGALLGMGCLGLAACGSTAEEESEPVEVAETSSEVVKEVGGELTGSPLRDKDDLYNVYDDSGVVTMYLTVSRGNEADGTDHSWAEINTYSAYDYEAMGVSRYQVNAILQVGDENGPSADEVGYASEAPNATVQIRGQSSSKNAQKNYKVKLKKNKGTWRGQRTIALNKHMSEGLRFRNKMAYDLIRGIEQMMGLRTQFVHLYVKDETSGSADAVFEDYGLYTQVEQLNKTALKAHGLDENAQLYKVNFFEFDRYEDSIKLADDPTYDLSMFEYYLEVKGNTDHSKLISMLEDVNDEAMSMDSVLAKWFDVENLTYWLAFQILLGNTDTQSRNCYLYSPYNSNTWYFLDWDNDGMLFTTEYALKGRDLSDSWEVGLCNYWGNRLFRRAFQSESFISSLNDAVDDLRGYFTSDTLVPMIEHYRDIVETYLWRSPDSGHMPISQEQHDAVCAALPDEVGQNYQDYLDSYKKPMPFYISTPVRSGDKLKFGWEASYDFDGEDIRYSFSLASDYTFSNPIYSQGDIVIPEVVVDTLDAGQYFVRVVARNKSGATQTAFDYYLGKNGKVYGVKCFYVGTGGSIVEETYDD